MRRILTAGLFAAGVLSGCAGGHSGVRSRVPGGPPPEWAKNAADWPSPNDGLSNTRANLKSKIDSRDVSELRKTWTFPLRYHGGYGAFTTNPIVAGGVVYFEDPDSTVFALSLRSGAVIWKREYHSPTPSGGPNGVALGYGLLFGETEGSVFALDPRTGRQVWIRKLATRTNEGIDMAPQLAGGRLLISTIPGSATSFYTRGAYGVVYALAAETGKVIWSFSTVRDPKRYGGGGLWFPPAVDGRGRVFLGVGNPSPYPLSPADPDARSRPGPNLYTDSIVALDARGKLLWYRQVTAHDLRDYDFQDSPVVTTEVLGGRRTEIVIGAGKSGKVEAFRASDGKRLWTLAIGRHNRWSTGPLPKRPVVYCPGSLGGVLTPLAEAAGRLFVPWIDLCFEGSATGLSSGFSTSPAGGIAALRPATGAVLWKHRFRDLVSGAATVANDVVFTSTYDGTIYALSTRNGAVLWKTRAPAGVNSFPAVTRSMLLVGAGAPTKSRHPRYELVAYSLP